MDNDHYTMRFDESEAPLLRVTYPQYATIDVVVQAFEMFCMWSERYKRLAYVIDMTDFNPLTAPPKLRKAFADEFQKSRHIIEPATVCEARVVSSSLVQGVITAVDWLTSRSYPAKNFTDHSMATSWVRKMLDKASR